MSLVLYISRKIFRYVNNVDPSKESVDYVYGAALLLLWSL